MDPFASNKMSVFQIILIVLAWIIAIASGFVSINIAEIWYPGVFPFSTRRDDVIGYAIEQSLYLTVDNVEKQEDATYITFALPKDETDPTRKEFRTMFGNEDKLEGVSIWNQDEQKWVDYQTLAVVDISIGDTVVANINNNVSQTETVSGPPIIKRWVENGNDLENDSLTAPIE